MKSGKSAQGAIAEFSAKLQKYHTENPGDEYIADILKDLTGQTAEAVSKPEFYQRWGRHYLPSLANAHEHQFCNNFKDPGVQHYGGQLFSKIRDVIDDLFCKLPPPTPSIPPARSYSSSSGSHSAASSSPVSMATYHHSSAPCFDGSCLVSMDDGSKKRVGEIKKGDVVQCWNQKTASVVCVVKTHTQNNVADLVTLDSGLLVTPWHPVRINGQWTFPNSVGKCTSQPCPAVFSFVLASSHVMIINDVECVTLGHQLSGETVQHPYFGTGKIVEDLAQMKGWDAGLVELDGSSCIQRDQSTGLVCKLYQKKP